MECWKFLMLLKASSQRIGGENCCQRTKFYFWKQLYNCSRKLISENSFQYIVIRSIALLKQGTFTEGLWNRIVKQMPTLFDTWSKKLKFSDLLMKEYEPGEQIHLLGNHKYTQPFPKGACSWFSMLQTLFHRCVAWFYALD